MIIRDKFSVVFYAHTCTHVRYMYMYHTSQDLSEASCSDFFCSSISLKTEKQIEPTPKRNHSFVSLEEKEILPSTSTCQGSVHVHLLVHVQCTMYSSY